MTSSKAFDILEGKPFCEVAAEVKKWKTLQNLGPYGLETSRIETDHREKTQSSCAIPTVKSASSCGESE